MKANEGNGGWKSVGQGEVMKNGNFFALPRNPAAPCARLAAGFGGAQRAAVRLCAAHACWAMPCRVASALLQRPFLGIGLNCRLRSCLLLPRRQ
jgi:hypothetical protein